MEDKVVNLNAGVGSFLASVSLFRMPDGSIRAVLDDMPVHVIEGEPTISRRFELAGFWLLKGACDLLRQSNQFDPSTRAEAPDQPTPKEQR